MAKQTAKRKTKETEITVGVDIENPGSVSVTTGLPFFDHILTSMAFHGGFDLQVTANGDVEVDPHHLVEDTGIVFGDCLRGYLDSGVNIRRYGHAVIPMDEALSEVTIDACGRPYLEFRAVFPQDRSGDFDMWLIREFLLALANRAMMNLHAACRYGDNSHHMAESLFKALGIALKEGFTPVPGAVRSTKGILHERGKV
ncbi:MAG: imidazoleglycerol-phosphate dehydratase HisB [Spirochaetales bacterium]|nr:imidazoleglycerol-phosphate dehydratase HisB [Spirochaetales bacterium]